MESFIAGLAGRGYSILFTAVLLETLGIPVPAALALLVAGAACAQGKLAPGLTGATAISAMMLGDTVMFLMGRYTGWWLLGLLCRLSLNPESCILRSADAFYRRGRTLLIFAKFVPGINTMAPPLAGSMNMRLAQFLSLDVIGASLYLGAYLSAGFLFSGALQAVIGGMRTAGRVMSWVVAVAVIVYVAIQVRMWMRARVWRTVPMITPEEAMAGVAAGAKVLDVRSHGYYDTRATRIQGSKRLEPNSLNAAAPGDLKEGPVYLYCTCVREATSGRVGKMLLDNGVQVAVIRGGLRAWKKAGLPVEPVPTEEVSPLPVFNS
jgi:membrane protein DedA with SNARE-associated domain/rhodanese-related sulfurtransferase